MAMLPSNVVRCAAVFVAVAAFLVLALWQPRPAFAEHGGPASDPDTSCPDGPLTVELGRGVSLPRQYKAAENGNTTITGTMRANPLFGAERVVFQRTIRAGAGLLLSEAPVIPTDLSTPLMNDVEVRIDFTTNRTGDTIIASCMYQVTTVPPAPLSDLIQVPVRFCAVEGSPAAEGKKAGDTVAGAQLLSTLAQANTGFWANQARIVFRPAFAADGFPVISDPDPNDGFDLGYVTMPQFGLGQVSSLARACLSAWESPDGYPDQVGLPVANARGIVAAAPTLGVVIKPDSNLLPQNSGTLNYRGDALCGHPRRLLVSDAQREWAVITDPNLFEGEALVYAHEFGHALLLGHGNGFDDNHDGLEPPAPGPRRFDSFCDPLGSDSNDVPHEDPPFVGCESSSLMNVSAGNGCGILRPLQVEQAREVAKLYPGATFAARQKLAGGAIAHEDRGCAPPCGLPPDIFLAQLEVATTPEAEVTSFSHTTLGGIPDDVSDRYLFFADLDNDSATGCAPADLGYDTSFQGADLVTSADVGPGSGTPSATPKVWRCEGGSLVEQSDQNLRAQAYTQTAAHGPPDAPLLGQVTVAVPDSVRGPAGSLVRVQGLAERAGTALRDRLPLAPDAGGVINLVPPDLPDCFVDPLIAAPGQGITVTAPDLPSGKAMLQFDGRELAASPSPRFAMFVPPANAVGIRTNAPTIGAGSIHTITISVGGAAAFCPLLVKGDARTPMTTASATASPSAPASLSPLATSGGPSLVGPLALVAALVLVGSSVAALAILRRGLS